jgi:hypothetical protein
MNDEELKLAIYTRPFEPMRIHLSDGATLDIHSPGAIALDRRTSGVVTGRGIQIISNLHITHVEPIAKAAT